MATPAENPGCHLSVEGIVQNLQLSIQQHMESILGLVAVKLDTPRKFIRAH
jgi:hypothetical protein